MARREPRSCTFSDGIGAAALPLPADTVGADASNADFCRLLADALGREDMEPSPAARGLRFPAVSPEQGSMASSCGSKASSPATAAVAPGSASKSSHAYQAGGNSECSQRSGTVAGSRAEKGVGSPVWTKKSSPADPAHQVSSSFMRQQRSSPVAGVAGDVSGSDAWPQISSSSGGSPSTSAGGSPTWAKRFSYATEISEQGQPAGRQQPTGRQPAPDQQLARRQPAASQPPACKKPGANQAPAQYCELPEGWESAPEDVVAPQSGLPEGWMIAQDEPRTVKLTSTPCDFRKRDFKELMADRRGREEQRPIFVLS